MTPYELKDLYKKLEQLEQLDKVLAGHTPYGRVNSSATITVPTASCAISINVSEKHWINLLDAIAHELDSELASKGVEFKRSMEKR